MTARRSHSSGRARPFSNIEFLYSLRPSSMKLGLENITGLLESFGDPQESFPAILVAGTNGKGSVTTYISSILREGGLKTGTFYSPHLFRINERVRIDGCEIPSRDLDDILGKLRERWQRFPFTFFEGMTAAAILHFQMKKVDIAVFEVGLGGRLDATRLVNAVTTVITGISKDHTQHLGRSGRKILTEKLGIARKGVPLVANLRSGALREAASAWCGAREIPFVDARDWKSRRLSSVSAEGTAFTLATPADEYGKISIPIIGRVQMENATTAVRSVETLRALPYAADMRLPGREGIMRGLAGATLPGRFQVIPGKPRIVLDVSHNEEALSAALDSLVKVGAGGRKRILLGIMARKELGRFPRLAAAAVDDIILVPLGSEGAAPAGQLAASFEGCGGRAAIRPAGDMREGVRMAMDGLGETGTLLVTGSHHTVEEAGSFL